VVNVVSPTKGPTIGKEKEKKREKGVEKEEDRRKKIGGRKFCSIPCLLEKLKYESLLD
jgi:hypothetical protein